MKIRSAFSLIEVTLSIGIIAVALLGIFALIPVGLTASRDSIDATRSSFIAQDIKSRVQSAATNTVFAGTGDINLGPWFYDREGTFLGDPIANSGSILYRVDAVIHGSWNSTPANVDASVLRPVTAHLAWPVDPTTLALLGNKAQSFTFYARRP